MPIQIVLALASPIASELACRELNRHRKHFKVVAYAHSAKELLKLIPEHRPDVAVVSAILQGDPDAGIKILREVLVASPGTRAIVLLDCSESQQVIDAFSAGARGVVCQTEPLEVLCKCIRSVHGGQIWANSSQLQWIVEALATREPIHVVDAKGMPLLTKREEQIVRMVAEGMPNNEISSNLSLSAHTVKNHLFRIYEKLGVSNRVELILYALSSKNGSQGRSAGL